jgi:YegS/Rv2252/BmrU family lipid kinase
VFTLGGDGLVGVVAGAIADTGAPLGVLPGGRGNDFARVLGIPGDPAEAVRALASAPVRKLDLAEANGRPFIGIASCGFDSVANRIANESRLVKGNLVYLYAALRAVATWKPARFELVLDGNVRVYSGWSVGACNSKAYGGGMYAAPNAELDDGLLDVVVCERTSRFNFVFRVLPRVFKGTHVDLPYVHEMRAREVTVSADRPFVMYADGDPVGDLPVTVRVRPGAVTVLAP